MQVRLYAAKPHRKSVERVVRIDERVEGIDIGSLDGSATDVRFPCTRASPESRCNV